MEQIDHEVEVQNCTDPNRKGDSMGLTKVVKIGCTVIRIIRLSSAVDLRSESRELTLYTSVTVPNV